MDRDWDAEKLALVERRQAAVKRIADLGPEGSTLETDEALLARSSAKLALNVVDLEIEAFDTQRAISSLVSGPHAG